ncbi:calcium-translocating P-type ATPase [Bradyrhizobium sp. R2.2-H]|uniref:cation-translocating P-type ATPase n=1 Tax=unclassified Bradyrhizobium TaxID=2631580 RepID=UPI001043E2E1|nr:MULTISPECIES: HAD-IC family P-type ATPase [unclassified Bradyrhizobium]TCU73401.1 calcium-translocating P-type ATPase [Bradyrhizobium sp. Y-H1]TCU76410.1 calcium-translocating P-type ATPase [Bradyrhizobium sp. R2.2-H]
MGSFHHLPADEVLRELSVEREGLSEAEAAERLRHHGPNRLPEPAYNTLLAVFVAQFRSPFIYLLFAAGAVALSIGHVTDAAFIAAVLVLNAGIGTFQEWRAETRARALKALIKASVSVWRGGTLQRLPSEALVPGDITQVESGERIAADLRLIEGQNLSVDESLLTGESLAVVKRPMAHVAADAGLSDRVTMLHAGTTVQTGRGLGVVVGTGSGTVVGQLAASLDRPEPQPPLIRRMAQFTRQLGFVMVAVVALIATMEALRGVPATDILLLSIALIVSAIPEGLPVAMTVALSIAMHRMGLRNVVVRHLPAVEGLGACTLIATDKTGTLTLNRLTIERVWTAERGEVSTSDESARAMLSAGAYASEMPAGSGEVLIGDAVDLAFFAAMTSSGSAAVGPSASVDRLPYEPEKRFAASFHEDGNALVAYVKGAPETVASFCGNADTEALAAAERMSADGYRVIAVAAGRVALRAEHGLTGLRLLGFAGLIDPLRPEAREAIGAAQRAGIRIVMVTGDHPLTALAIARQLGLAHEPEEVVTGADLARLRDKALDDTIAAARVFARTEPLQKLTIIESLRRQNHVVAVTGDGINDAPALHAADIGIAMGKGGTDVARDAADLILTDDNFASIVAGVEEGRIAYDNVRKVITLLISTGAAEILLMLLSTSFGLPPPLTAVQLLWLNLITNGLQDVALAFEKAEPDVLQRRPRDANAAIFDARMIEQVVLSGAAIGLTAFAAYALMLRNGVSHVAAQGAILWLLVWCENAHAFNCRSEVRSVFRIPIAANPFLVAAVIGTQVLQLVVLAIPPLREMLSLQAMTWADALQLAVGGLGALAVMELYKWSRRASDRRRLGLSVLP